MAYVKYLKSLADFFNMPCVNLMLDFETAIYTYKLTWNYR